MRRVPRVNRVDPWGDLHGVTPRGLFTGNRGCLVDGDGRLVRHHRGSLWITCVTAFRGRRVPLDAPGRWTPLFFLDDAVALAAGHRPCGYCRRDQHLAYRDAVARALARAGGPPDPGPAGRVRARDLDRRLAAERLRRGRGLARAGDRRLWPAPLDELPSGTVVALDGEAHLVHGPHLFRFAFDGWQRGPDRPAGVTVDVITPRTSVLALGAGYSPVLHASAGQAPGS
jgi:hypothetical protein